MDERVLHLPVSAKWFKLIKEGVKRVEYREIKAYWIKMLFWHVISWPDGRKEYERIGKGLAELYENPTHLTRLTLKFDIEKGYIVPRYNQVEFTEGYPKKEDNERRARFLIDSITIGNPQKGLCPDEFLGNEYLCINFK